MIVRALQLARIAALLLLLVATGWATEARVQSMARVSMEDYWGPWVMTVLLSLAFVIVALLGRLQSHPWPVLAVEVLIAGAVAVVPPIYWAIWLGVGGPWVTAMIGGFAQPLAIAWAAIAGFRVFRQIRQAPTPQERHSSTTASSRHSDEASPVGDS